MSGMGDAVPRGGHGLEAGLGDGYAARLTGAVAALGELGQRPFDIIELITQGTGQRLGLALFGGYLTRVGEVLVEGQTGVGAGLKLSEL